MSAPLHFQPHIGSAVDEENRIGIYRPRLVTAQAPYDMEYQYPIFKNDKRFEGIALGVTDSWARGRSSSERIFVIDLATAQAIDSALEVKSSLGLIEDDLTFLRELSRGLVAVFQSRTDNAHVVRYIVVTSVREIVARGVNDTSQLEVMEDGRAILAQVIVRARRIMALQFQPQPCSSLDHTSGIAIPRPRMLPTTLANGQPGTEYQYTFVREGKVIGGLGFEGSEQLVETAGRRERIFTFDLGHDWLIQYMVQLKLALGIAADDFSFVRGLAEGLVMALAGQVDNDENLRYVVITTEDALSAAGIPVPKDIIRHPTDIIVLAETAVPSSAH